MQKRQVLISQKASKTILKSIIAHTKNTDLILQALNHLKGCNNL
jgi:hypothetical protein